MTAQSVAPAASGTAPSAGSSRRRRVGGWIAIAVVLALVGGIGVVLAGLSQWAQRDALDPDSAGPSGTRALVEILREQGVEVVVAHDRAAVREALAPGTTLVLPDMPALSDAAVRAVTDGFDDVVLIEPRARTLRLFLPRSSPAGVAADVPVEPGCDLPEAERSGAVAPGAVYEPGPDIDACYPTADTSSP